MQLPYLGTYMVNLKNPSDPTCTNKVVCRLKGKLSHYDRSLRYYKSSFVWHEIGNRESRRGLNLWELWEDISNIPLQPQHWYSRTA